MKSLVVPLLLCLGTMASAQQAPKTAVKAQPSQKLPTLSKDSRGVQGFVFAKPDGSGEFRRADSLRAAGALPFRTRNNTLQQRTDTINTKNKAH